MKAIGDRIIVLIKESDRFITTSYGFEYSLGIRREDADKGKKSLRSGEIVSVGSGISENIAKVGDIALFDYLVDMKDEWLLEVLPNGDKLCWLWATDKVQDRDVIDRYVYANKKANTVFWGNMTQLEFDKVRAGLDISKYDEADVKKITDNFDAAYNKEIKILSKTKGQLIHKSFLYGIERGGKIIANPQYTWCKPPQKEETLEISNGLIIPKRIAENQNIDVAEKGYSNCVVLDVCFGNETTMNSDKIIAEPDCNIYFEHKGVVYSIIDNDNLIWDKTL